MLESGNLRSLNLSEVQKRALLKLAVDLVKADNRIHSKEISVLESIQNALLMSQTDIDLIHYITLSEAISIIRNLDKERVQVILDLFNHIMRADSDIDFEENLLLSAIEMSCKDDSNAWCSIVSAVDLDSDIPDKQIIYLEKNFCKEAHAILDDKYDNLLVSKAIGDIGFELFYLPNVLESLGLATIDKKERLEKFSLLQKSMEFLVPSGDKVKVNNLEKTLNSYTIENFFKVVISRYALDPDIFPYNSFILVKIRESEVLDDDNVMKPTMDFLCLDLSKDVKKRILELVSKFEEKTNLLPYEGYYKVLYDDLSCEAKVSTNIVLDDDFNFCLEGLDMEKVSFESSPQARTLYLLLLHYGKNGISQETILNAISRLKAIDTSKYCSSGVFDLELLKKELALDSKEESRLILNTITIYQAVSNKDEQKATYVNYIISILSHRSSLKTYVNKGWGSILSLANPEQYFIRFSKDSDSYFLGIGPSRFLVQSKDNSSYPITESHLWKSLR